MAYAGTFTPYRGGQGAIVVIIDETEAGPATELAITGMPLTGTVVRQISILTGGAVGGATTIDPVLGLAANPGNDEVICENGTPVAQVDNAGEAPYLSTTPDGTGSSTCTLYHRARVNVGTATVRTRYLIRPGW